MGDLSAADDRHYEGIGSRRPLVLQKSSRRTAQNGRFACVG